MSRRFLRPLFLSALLLLAGSGCAGPRPIAAVEQVSAPDAPGQPCQVRFTVRNRGGEGQVAVTIRLLSATTGTLIGETERDVDLRAGETATLIAPITPGGPGPYRAQIEAQYPPE